MSSTAGAVETRASRPEVAARDLVAAVWLAFVLLAVGLALFLTCRRLAGVLLSPLAGEAIVAFAAGLETVAIALRHAANQHLRSVPRNEYSVLVRLLPGTAAVMMLAALTLPGTPAWGLATAWLLVIGGEATSWFLHRPRTARRRQAESEAPIAALEPEIPDGLVQRMTRIRRGDRESLHALLQAEVAANDRAAVVHVAFCPPLPARPELTAHALDSDDADVRIAQVETFGARIEIRLPLVQQEPRHVLVEILGSVTCRPCA
jgi:hypothetical protein